MSASLQQHGRSIVDGFATVEHRQGADCGELVSTSSDEGLGDGLTRSQQIGIALAVLVVIVGGGAAAVGGL